MTKRNFMKMYKGAGILFVRIKKGKVEVLLGNRSNKSQKDLWDVPGGTMEKKDRNDFLRCALRKTKEEILCNEKGVISVSPKRIINVCKMHIPFLFQFQTYIIDVSDMNLDFRPNQEFNSIEWCNIKELPRRTHIGVRYSLLQLSNTY